MELLLRILLWHSIFRKQRQKSQRVGIAKLLVEIQTECCAHLQFNCLQTDWFLGSRAYRVRNCPSHIKWFVQCERHYCQTTIINHKFFDSYNNSPFTPTALHHVICCIQMPTPPDFLMNNPLDRLNSETLESERKHASFDVHLMRAFLNGGHDKTELKVSLSS